VSHPAFPDAPPVLTTPRLVLRAHDERDLDALWAMFTDPTTMRYWGSPAWTDRAQAAAFVERNARAFAAKESVRLALEPKGGGPIVGTCTLFAIDAQNRRAETGYILASSAWGAGLMTEAMAALLDWGFGGLGLHRVEADVDPRNEPSVRILERLGFTREGHLRQRWQVNGEISDSWFYGLLAPEWAARRA